MGRPRIAKEVPDPPPITEEARRKILDEASAWSAEIGPRVRSIESLTAEDWATRVR